MPRQENLIRSQTCMQLYFSSSFYPRTSKYGEDRDNDNDSDSEVADQEENVSTDNVCTSKRRKLTGADVPVVVSDEGTENKNIAFGVDGREGDNFIERHVRFRNYYNISSDSSRDSLQHPTVRTAVLSRHEGSLQKLQGISIAATGQEPLSNDVCKLTFLGTGCASPSKFRHNSAILITFPRGSAPPPVQIPGQSGFRPPPPRGPPPPPPPHVPKQPNKEITVPSQSTDGTETSILLDCGEGCVTQLYQQCGGDSSKFDSRLLSISCIWISHHHADHVCGLPMLIEHVHKATLRRSSTENASSSSHNQSITKKILVMAPPAVLGYYEYFLTVTGLDDYVTFCPTAQTTFVGANRQMIVQATNGHVCRLVSVPVFHCRDAYGCVLEMVNPHYQQQYGQFASEPATYKLVYSGDCRPSPSILAAAGAATASGVHNRPYCDILIHEATFSDDRQADAVTKKHSTYSEALDMAARLNMFATSYTGARLVVLTHFSQRYCSTSSNNNGSSILPGGSESVSLVRPSAPPVSSNAGDDNSIDIDDIDSDNVAPLKLAATVAAASASVPATSLVDVVTAVDYLEISFPSQTRAAALASKNINAMYEILLSASASAESNDD
jgi:ribonuclease BN (tRNA processing enzyme)